MRVICDLDGVVYRGEQLLPGSDTALVSLVQAGIETVFVTNNSTYTPAGVVEKLGRLTGLVVGEGAVVTSAQAAASMLTPEDGPAYVLGSEAISIALDDAGIAETGSADDSRSVVVGLDRSLSYDRLATAADALRKGARFIATNTDPTFPTENGLKPGSGAVVAALEKTTGLSPEVAGKPHRPIRSLIRLRGVTDAYVIGDRIDTDVALALDEPDWISILVLSGVSQGDPGLVADHVCLDLRAAVDLVLAAVPG